MTVSYKYPCEVLAALDRTPDAIAVQSGDQVMTNGQVANRIRVFTLHLLARGVRPGSCVVIGLKSDISAAFLGLAANLIGARWAMFHEKMPLKLLGHAVLIHDADWPVSLRFPGMFVLNESWAVAPAASAQPDPALFSGPASPDDAVLMARTSGTTGTPKFMLHMASSMGHTSAPDDMRSLECITLLFPVNSWTGYCWMIHAFVAGVRLVFPSQITGAVTALQAAGSNLVFASPGQLDALCQGQALLATRIRLARIGGAIITPEALRHWLGFFDELVISYASTEAGWVGQIRFGQGDDVTKIEYDVRPDAAVEVVDDAGRTCPDEVPGVIRVRSPRSHRHSGYLGAPEATAEVFRDGWFYPGDIGIFTKDGRFRVLGRVKDQFNLGGVKANAADVDAAAKSIAGVEAAMCGTIRTSTGIDQLYLCVVATPGHDVSSLALAIRRACRRHVGPSVKLTGIAFVDTLPLTPTGKSIRREIGHMINKRALL